MNKNVPSDLAAEPLPHSGLAALCGIAAYYRIAADPAHLVKELAVQGAEADGGDLVRAAKMIGLKARVIENPSASRLAGAPVPAILQFKTGGYGILGGATPAGIAGSSIPPPGSRVKFRSTNCRPKPIPC